MRTRQRARGGKRKPVIELSDSDSEPASQDEKEDVDVVAGKSARSLHEYEYDANYERWKREKQAREDEQGVANTAPLPPSGSPTNQAPHKKPRVMIAGFDGYNRRVIDSRPGHERYGYAPPDSPPARQLRSIVASTSTSRQHWTEKPATTTTQAWGEGPVQRFCWNNQSLARPVEGPVPAKGDKCAFNIIDVYNIV